VKTVLEVLQSTTAYLEKHGVENARLNSEHLVAHGLGRKRIEMYLEFDRLLAEEELEPLRVAVKRRAQGEPLQHLLGTVDFYGRTFLSDGRALIPRPETERFVELLLESEIQNPKSRILDVGTGSGIIAVTIAAERPQAEVDALDICPAALSLARENAQRLGVGDRINFFESDLLTAAHGPYDLCVANLPYVPAAAIPTLTREVQHDPARALDGGSVGTEIINRLIAELPVRLAAGGRVALEIGIDQAPALSDALRAKNFHDITARTDYLGVTRFLFATYG
jgi:release factor glutamine methyltransferase